MPVPRVSASRLHPPARAVNRDSTAARQEQSTRSKTTRNTLDPQRIPAFTVLRLAASTDCEKEQQRWIQSQSVGISSVRQRTAVTWSVAP
jgi:hypothetical protein